MSVTLLSKVKYSPPLLNFSFCQLSNSLPRSTPFTRAFRTSSNRMVVHNIENKAKFDETIRNNKIVVVDAYATWCGPCRAIAPIIDVLSSNHSHAHFVKFDVERIPELAESLEIRAMPTFIFFKDAKKVQEIVGANSIEVERIVKEMA